VNSGKFKISDIIEICKTYTLKNGLKIETFLSSILEASNPSVIINNIKSLMKVSTLNYAEESCYNALIRLITENNLDKISKIIQCLQSFPPSTTTAMTYTKLFIQLVSIDTEVINFFNSCEVQSNDFLEELIKNKYDQKEIAGLTNIFNITNKGCMEEKTNLLKTINEKNISNEYMFELQVFCGTYISICRFYQQNPNEKNYKECFNILNTLVANNIKIPSMKKLTQELSDHQNTINNKKGYLFDTDDSISISIKIMDDGQVEIKGDIKEELN
jgi:hypothetical protein